MKEKKKERERKKSGREWNRERRKKLVRNLMVKKLEKPTRGPVSYS